MVGGAVVVVGAVVVGGFGGSSGSSGFSGGGFGLGFVPTRTIRYSPR